MCNEKGWSVSSIHTNIKRYVWFTPDLWGSYKQGFMNPNIITIQGLKHLNSEFFPGFRNMFYAGVGYATHGKSSLVQQGWGNYLSKVPLIGSTAVNRMGNEANSQVFYTLGGMSSAIATKFIAMSFLGTLTRITLQSRSPQACAIILPTLKVINYLNTAGGIVDITHQYSAIREQRMVKSLIKSCESVGKEELEKMLINAANGLTKQGPGE
jgi:hypothetical protein